MPSVWHKNKGCEICWPRFEGDPRKLYLMIIGIHLIKSAKAGCGLRLKVIRASCEQIRISFLN